MTTVKRDYVSEDSMSIYPVDMTKFRQIRDTMPIDCQCCLKVFRPVEKDNEIYLWLSYTDTLDDPDAKLIYCRCCLNHFGARSCPTTRKKLRF